MDGKTLHKYKTSMLTGEQDLGDFFQEHEAGGSPGQGASCVQEESALMSPGGRHGTTARRSFSRKSSATTLIPAEQCAHPSPSSSQPANAAAAIVRMGGGSKGLRLKGPIPCIPLREAHLIDWLRLLQTHIAGPCIGIQMHLRYSFAHGST